MNQQELDLSKRHPNYSLRTSKIYGLNNDKREQVLYRFRNVDDETILYGAARYLVEENDDDEQMVRECRSRNVGYLAIN